MKNANEPGKEPLGQDLAAFLAETATADLGGIVVALADAAKSIAALIARGPLGGALGATLGANSDGDIQKALDIFADKAFEDALTGTQARAFISEERETPTSVNPDGRFLLAFDPLDGSSNIDVNVTIGSIFSILDAPAAATVDVADFLQPGNRQRAAGMFIYGPNTALVFSLGAGTHVATLDPATGEFRMTQLHFLIPEGRAEFAINASNARHWPAPVRAYVDDCLMGEPGPRAKDFNMRWIASLVADGYRIMHRGGAYLYPDDARAGYAQGRLRLLYEANPISMLVEQAGGLAIDGVNRILDLPPKTLHARTPLIFGSTDKVERIRSYFVDGHRSAARAPLFGKRGLLR